LPKLCKASKGVAVIPLTSIESHGPHLPLGSDPLCFEYVLAGVVKKETVAVLPILPYSYVAEARVLPGAIHIKTSILTSLVENICDEVYRNGFDKIVLLHGHGGNFTLLNAFGAMILEKEKPYAVYTVPVFAGNGDKVTPLLETKEGGHACEMETSMNMVACPELVNLKAIGKRTFPTLPGPNTGVALTPVEWIARHPNMAVGVPQKGTVAKGKKILKLWIDGIVDHLRMIKKDTICLKAMKDYAKRVNGLRT
jgi:creatinine amidohydrolase